MWKIGKNQQPARLRKSALTWFLAVLAVLGLVFWVHGCNEKTAMFQVHPGFVAVAALATVFLVIIALIDEALYRVGRHLDGLLICGMASSIVLAGCAMHRHADSMVAYHRQHEQGDNAHGSPQHHPHESLHGHRDRMHDSMHINESAKSQEHNHAKTHSHLTAPVPSTESDGQSQLHGHLPPVGSNHIQHGTSPESLGDFPDQGRPGLESTPHQDSVGYHLAEAEHHLHLAVHHVIHALRHSHQHVDSHFHGQIGEMFHGEYVHGLPRICRGEVERNDD